MLKWNCNFIVIWGKKWFLFINIKVICIKYVKDNYEDFKYVLCDEEMCNNSDWI